MPKICIQEGCMKRPTFNLPDQIKPIYCFEHKKENMIDIKNKKCIHEFCQVQPSYNFQDQKKAIYCFEHKKKI